MPDSIETPWAPRKLTQPGLVTKKSQADVPSLSNARVLFKSVCDDFLEAKHRLNVNTLIFGSLDFENGICKVQEARADDITAPKSEIIVPFSLPDTEVQPISDFDLSYAEKALKRKVKDERFSGLYIDNQFV